MPGRSFAEVLDEVLSAEGTGREPAAATSRRIVPPPHPFLFSRSATASVVIPAPGAEARQPSPRSADAARLFTAEEHRAVHVLVALGAALRPGFGPGELRRQYRLLARRLHPDRHPGASVEERTRLSRAFAAATDAYRLLAAAAVAH